ncbi:uncharacterized protein LOC119985257 isoform X2 [Tripterygium wilfordii]|uniref:uncharacterized protein LOC119985257 isoform X2 n=1 Tax=Tripterygium wilfordii TaxID=458696 RepID=UPI0018F83F9D|nr:uncharacterized protein LOC119985257 isoform X2 [Tripterygium wilfordii]
MTNTGALDLIMDVNVSTQYNNRWKQMGCEEKKTAVDEEIKRMKQLPSNSAYVSHRLRVLNKILHLMSAERTASVEQELELLFAKLSL